jgi:hypothetical protein
MNAARSNIVRLAFAALLLSRAPTSVRSTLAFMLLGALVVAVAVIVVAVSARSEPSDPQPPAAKALESAAMLILYYTKCAKLTVEQLPQAGRDVIGAAKVFCTDEAIGDKVVEIFVKIKNTGRPFEEWCSVMKAFTSPELLGER